MNAVLNLSISNFDLLIALANTSATYADLLADISNTFIAVDTKSTDCDISERVPVARSDTAAIVWTVSEAE